MSSSADNSNHHHAGAAHSGSSGGSFVVAYHPQVSGTHTLHVKYSKTHISGSPFTIRVVASLPAHPAYTRCTGEGMGVKNDIEAGCVSSFTILAHGSDGAPKSRGGDAFAVTVTGSDPRK